MPRPIPVDLILHALVESLLELPEDHLRDLARAISAHCIDPRHVADQWCDGAGVASSADWIRRRLDRTQDWFVGLHIISAETRAMEVTIARRLADVGLALLVTQDAEDRATASLLLDASRLVVGLERAQVDNNGLTATIANLREMRNAAVAENDLWHGWAKTVAGIPSSHNPHDETLRDAVEKRIIAAETAPRPVYESFATKIRTALDLNADAPEAEIITAAYGVLRAARDGGFQYVERMRDSGLLAEANKHAAAAAAALAKIGIAIRLGSDATVDAIIARATLLADDDAQRAVMARRPPHERLTWVARFNNSNGGASITLDGHTLFVSGKIADDLGDALCGWRTRREHYVSELAKAREKITAKQAEVDALTADLKSARDDLDLWRTWGAALTGTRTDLGGPDIRDAVEKRIIAAETAPRPAHESLVASLRAELDGARHDMKNADAEIVVWKAERDAAIAEMVAIRAELDEARDCARREVAWVPKDVAIRPTFKPGDRVVIARKTDSETCPWEDSDDNLIGRTGEVQYIDSDNDVRVIVDGDWFWFSSACLDPAPPDTRTMRKRLIDRGLDPATIDAALETKLPQFIAPTEAAEHPQFKVGDRVRFVNRVGDESDFDDAPPLGWEGVVDEDDRSELPLRVVGQHWGARDYVWWFIPAALDLITPNA